MKQAEILQKIDQIRSDYAEKCQNQQSQQLGFFDEYSRLQKAVSKLGKKYKELICCEDPKWSTLYGGERREYLRKRSEQVTELSNLLDIKKFEMDAVEHLIRETSSYGDKLRQEFKEEVNKLAHEFNQKLRQSVQRAQEQFAPTMTRFFQAEVEKLEEEYREVNTSGKELESYEDQLRCVQLKISEVKRIIKDADRRDLLVSKSTIDELTGYLHVQETLEKKIDELYSKGQRYKIERIRKKLQRTRAQIKDPQSSSYEFQKDESEIFNQLVDENFTKDGSDSYKKIREFFVDFYRQEFSRSMRVGRETHPRFEDFAILGSDFETI